MSDPKNTHGVPGPDEQADTASGGAPQDDAPADASAAHGELGDSGLDLPSDGDITPVDS